MADVTEVFARSTTARLTDYRQSIEPVYYAGSFIKDDTDNHDFIIPSNGKVLLTVGIWSTASSSFNGSVYGQVTNTTGSIPGVGIFALASSTFSSSGNGGAYFAAGTPYPVFPFYRIRIIGPSTADGSSAIANVYAHLG